MEVEKNRLCSCGSITMSCGAFLLSNAVWEALIDWSKAMTDTICNHCMLTLDLN